MTGLLFNKTEFDQKQEKMLFVCNEAVIQSSKTSDQHYSDPSPNGECFLDIPLILDLNFRQQRMGIMKSPTRSQVMKYFQHRPSSEYVMVKCVQDGLKILTSFAKSREWRLIVSGLWRRRLAEQMRPEINTVKHFLPQFQGTNQNNLTRKSSVTTCRNNHVPSPIFTTVAQLVATVVFT